MDTQTQIDRLIELAIIQRSELKQLVEQLPQLREHLNAEVEKVFDETEPQLRAELEEWTTKQTADKTAALGVALEAKIADLAKSLEVSTQARYNAIIAEREENARLAAEAEAKIAEHAASLPGAVKEIVSAELARFPRAGEIDQLRKEFAEPRGLNPRGKWQAGETYNKLDLVTINGDSYTSNTDGNRTRPSRSSADWTLVAARGTGGGGGPTSLSELTTVPSDGDLLIGSGTSWVTSNLTAGAGISITVGPGAITISATDGDITLDDGTAASPSLHFTNDPDTGIYRPAANTLGISVSGTQVAYFDENGLTVPSAGVVAGGSIHAGNGNANNPSLSFDGDQDTGFYRHQANGIGIALGGTQYADFHSSGFSITPSVTIVGALTANGTSIPASKTLVVTTDKISALAATTSAELAGKITDETGTGALVFANTPTLVTPAIGAATGTSLTVTGNVTASDTILGTSGPSVKSSLSARAPRQGLVFNGTAGATVSVPALGTADYTFAIWINPTSLSTAEKRLLGSDGVGAFEVQIDRGTAGNIAVIKSNSSVVTTTGALLSAGKLQLVTITRTSTSGVISINGVQAATFTDSQNYTAVSDKIGSILSPASYYNGTLIGPLVYNRALSASEVVALYEAGAPAGADYNNASNTLLNTSTALNAYSTSFTTFTGASATGFTASDATASKSPRVIFPLSGTLVAGRRYRAKFTATLTAMSSVNLWQSDSSYAGLANLGAVSSGSNEFTFTATSSVNAMMLLCTTDGSVGTHSVVISGLSVDTPGLLLAPDAAQAGGGLVWYDTSGNAANITLPASGVSWNVPTSGKMATSLNVNAAASLFASTSNSTSISDVDTTAALISKGSGTPRLYFGNENAANRPFIQAGVGGGSLFMVLQPYGGNVLVGALTDGGQKLQVNGDSGFLGHLEIPADKHIYMKQGNPLRWSADGLDTGTMRADIYADSGGILYFRTNGTTAALNIDASQNATFAGNVTVAASKVFTHNGQNGYSLALSTTADRAFKFEGSASGNDYTTSFTNAGAGKHNLSCSGAIAIGNTVQTASGVASTHKVTISIGGSTYYLLATNV